MANNANKRTGSGQPARPQPAQRVQAKSVPTTAAPTDVWQKRSTQIFIALGIAIITWLFLQPCVNNQFTNWDDPGYIKDNSYIKDLSGEGLSLIFTKAVMGNYHPLTILSYAIEYSYVRLEPTLYHIDSLLIHIVCTLLVYWFVSLLTRKPVAGIVASLLFGLHPMHVESVAWLAGRKDVLYGMFYMMGCVAYVYYLRSTSGKWKWYGAVILCFLLSLLSKPVAVVLPVTLLLIDYFEGRLLLKDETTARYSINWKAVIKKIPHFAIAIGFGIKSVVDQKKFGALATQDVNYNFLERIALGGYAFVTYLWKAVVPVGLSNFYPYPLKDGNLIQAKYFVFPFIAIALVLLAWKFARRNKVLVFGFLFFLVNIALLLQFIPVGGAIIADRYSYIPYLGLFFICGVFVADILADKTKSQCRSIIMGASIAYIGLLGYLSNERCRDWYDTTSLWRDEIEKHPETPNAFNNLGFNYFNLFNESVNGDDKRRYFDSSYFLLNRAIELDSKFVNATVSLGELFRAAGRFAEAKSYYYRALAINDKEGNANAYLGLAIVYAIAHNFDSAGFCFREAVANKPYFPEAHTNLGNYYDMMGKTDSALAQYQTSINQNPDVNTPYLNRGRLLYRNKKYQESMADLDRAASLRPDIGEIFYWRAICSFDMNNRAQASADLDKAISLGFKEINPNFVQAVRGGR
jgi:tetratricopeptide (TPR) repeat protein